MPRKLSAVLASVLFLGLCLAPSIASAQSEASKESAPAAKQGPEVRTLGVLIFPGFELLDAYGPLEMWGNIKELVKIVIVSKEKGEVASHQGPKTVAEYGFTDCPELDLLLVPGGFGVLPLLNDPAYKEFVKKQSAKAEITMSVCNGASILASAGLLDGRPATTNKAYWALATSPGPNTKWVKQARWVDDGNVVTSSGVSAGIDMSLHVIARLFGKQVAEGLALGTEYDWHEDPSWDPFAKAHGLVESE